MKIVNFYTEVSEFKVVSENEKIKTDVGQFHQEMILEDNSMIIFQDTQTYYDIISDANMYIDIDKDINLENLLSNIVATDTMSKYNYYGHDVILIHQISYGKHILYYLVRSGLNNVSV